MGEILDKCKDRAEEAGDKALDRATDKATDEVLDKAEKKVNDLIHKTTHTVNDKTSKELLESDWCVQKEGGGGLNFIKVEPCGAHSLEDCDPMVLKCSDGQDLAINLQCSKCKKHCIIRAK